MGLASGPTNRKYLENEYSILLRLDWAPPNLLLCGYNKCTLLYKRRASKDGNVMEPHFIPS